MRTQSDLEKDKGAKSFIRNMTSHWYVFVISVVVFIGLAFAYLKYATPQYLVSGVLMLKDQKTMPESQAVTSFASDNGLSFLLKPSENVMNEMKVLTSRRLALEVVKELKLNIKIGIKDGLKFEEIYDQAPFDIEMTNIQSDSIKERNFEIEFLENGNMRIVNEEEGINKVIDSKQSLQTSQYQFSVQQNQETLPLNK
ncbi:MAG: Wzz/FepE/Etk N-terminal domain-containing protein, partial [Sphingobacterium sp.]